LKKQYARQISVSIPNILIDKIIESLTLIQGFEKKTPTSKYEVLRGQVGGKTVIVYRSGSIVYDESLKEVRNLLEKILYEYYEEEGITVGSDEAGKGEALGPLVVSATALSPRQAAYLQAIGVADSKIVPENRIQELASEVKRVSLGYSILMINPQRFNEMFRTKKYGNLNNILARGHVHVLKKVVSKIGEKPEKIIVDKFDSSKSGLRIRIIEEVFKGLEVEAVERGEVFPAVAAASILARNSYLTWIRRNISREMLEKIRNKGYSAISKEELSRFFKIHYLKGGLKSGKT
jgi:ribonuclease HIII